MITSLIALLLILAPQTKQLIDNQHVTVWEATGQTPEASKNDRVLIDLDHPGTAVFVSKGTTPKSQKHGIVIDIKDVHITPISNPTSYPLAFPREGVKKLFENDRVIIWDYTWTPGKPTVMHFHDKDVVVVYQADGKLKSTTLDGKSVVNTISFGLTTFNLPNRTHSEEVVEGKTRAVITEFKQ
jgi:hypothetical protein